jgi:hypothetical protein
MMAVDSYFKVKEKLFRQGLNLSDVIVNRTTYEEFYDNTEDEENENE